MLLSSKEPTQKSNSCGHKLRSLLSGLKLLFMGPITRYLLIGNLILSICQFLFSYSPVKYFNFYGRETTFSVINACCVIFGGCTSCLLSGKIAERFDKKTYRAKSLVSTTMCSIAVPLCLGLFLVHNFVLSSTLLFLYDPLCLGYYAPVMSMIQVSVDVKNKGAAIGAF
jgi:hypothetical protein